MQELYHNIRKAPTNYCQFKFPLSMQTDEIPENHKSTRQHA